MTIKHSRWDVKVGWGWRGWVADVRRQANVFSSGSVVRAQWGRRGRRRSCTTLDFCSVDTEMRQSDVVPTLPASTTCCCLPLRRRNQAQPSPSHPVPRIACKKLLTRSSNPNKVTRRIYQYRFSFDNLKSVCTLIATLLSSGLCYAIC